MFWRCSFFNILEENQENIVQAVTALEKEQRRNLQGPLVKMNGAKLFMEGVIEGETWYLHEPYNTRTGYRGVPIWGQQAYIKMIQTLDKAKFPIHVHSIGDAVTTETLDALAHAQYINGTVDMKWRIFN